MDYIISVLGVILLLFLICLPVAIFQGVRAEIRERKRSRITVIGITCILVNIPLTFAVMSFETSEEPSRFFQISQNIVFALFYCGGILGGVGLLIDWRRSRKRPKDAGEPNDDDAGR